jgi:(S)-ureidoglycine aminohydrolase
MGYRDKHIGYPDTILHSRAIIKKGHYALIPPEGLVKNRIPGFINCEATILSSPKLGASFVDYLATVLPGGKNTDGFGGLGVEAFAYVLSGTIRTGDGKEIYDLSENGYIFVPADKKLYWENTSDEPCELFLYKRRYTPIEGYAPYTVCGNANRLNSYDYEGMTDVQITDLLPIDDMAFDMNFHILSFERGASHGYIETHVQEHGALVLEGEGMYNLDNDWIPVKKGDYIFMAAYSLQACYCVGREPRFSYLYSKDCNRDERI